MLKKDVRQERKSSRKNSAVRRRSRNATWRAQVLVAVDDARTQLTWLRALTDGREHVPSEVLEAYATAAEELLDEARGIANGRASLHAAISGAHIQTASEYLHAAELNLLRLSPADHLTSRLPDIQMEALRHLPATDLRLEILKAVTSETQKNPEKLSRRDRSSIIQIQKAVNGAIQDEQSRVRSFRNVIVGVSLAITLLVLGLAFMGWRGPATLPMCFVPDSSIVVCPTDETALPPGDASAVEISDAERAAAGSWDIAVVAFVGLLGATLAAAAGLRSIRGSSDPFSLPVALALLKLPSGAFTAVLGLLLIRAGFVPGLSALDTSAQIVAYSILLGYSQQLFTTFVDRQAQSVLAEAGSTASSASPPASH